MEACSKKLAIFALVMALALVHAPVVANGQNMCHMSKEGFDSCRPSVSGPSPVEPSAPCCSALSQADLQCLCMFKNYPKLLSAYNINPVIAVQLPATCNLGESFHC